MEGRTGSARHRQISFSDRKLRTFHVMNPRKNQALRPRRNSREKAAYGGLGKR
jgi:hypothetical protein